MIAFEMNAAQRRRLGDQIREAVKRELSKGARSQNQIADDSAIDHGALSRFMSGTRGLSIEAIERLAEELSLEIVKKRKSSSKKRG